MEVARRKVGDYYETEEKLTHSVAVVAKGRSRGAVEAPNERGRERGHIAVNPRG